MSELTDDRRETIQELINIGFGRAMASLAEVLGTRILLSVPAVALVSPEVALDQLAEVLGTTTRVTLVEQVFRGDFAGEAALVFAESSGRELVRVVQHSADFHPEVPIDHLELEVLLEVGNVVVGACLGSFAELLQTYLSFEPPQVLLEELDSPALREHLAAAGGQVLLVQTEFSVDEHPVRGCLVILLSERCFAWLFQALDSFLVRLVAGEVG